MRRTGLINCAAYLGPVGFTVLKLKQTALTGKGSTDLGGSPHPVPVWISLLWNIGIRVEVVPH